MISIYTNAPMSGTIVLPERACLELSSEHAKPEVEEVHPEPEDRATSSSRDEQPHTAVRIPADQMVCDLQKCHL